MTKVLKGRARNIYLGTFDDIEDARKYVLQLRDDKDCHVELYEGLGEFELDREPGPPTECKFVVIGWEAHKAPTVKDI